MEDLFSEIKSIVNQAESIQRAVDRNASDMAQLLVGRLRQVNKSGLWRDHLILKKMKRELKDFNSHTGEWK